MKTRNLPKQEDNLPAVFGHIDKAMKMAWGLEELRALGIPAKGVIEYGKVRAKPIVFEDLGVEIVIVGYLDKAVMLDDGSAAVIEFKTTDPSPHGLKLFSRQIHAYQYGLEHPAIQEPLEVTRLALVVYNAYAGTFKIDKKALEAVKQEDTARIIEMAAHRKGGDESASEPTLATPRSFSCAMTGTVVHYPVDIDRQGFELEVQRIAQIAAMEDMPHSGEGCMICAHAAEINRYQANLAAMQDKKRAKAS